jgi:type I restriction enzyme S subunit
MHWFNSPLTQRAIERCATGTTRRRISRTNISRLSVSWPPIDEQRRIAAILDAVDELRARRRQAITKMDSLIQSIFTAMFSDVDLRDSRFEERSLKDVCSDIRTGPFGSLLHQEDYVVGGVPLVNPMHISDGSIVPDVNHTVDAEAYDRLRVFSLCPGDIVLGRRGEMGRCSVVPDDSGLLLCGSGSMLLRLNDGIGRPEYLAAFLSSRTGRTALTAVAKGVTMLNLNSGSVGKIPIIWPSRELQDSFVDRIRSVAASKVSSANSMLKLDSLFESLQHRAFRGEL